jgi:nematocidal protein AidA
MSQTETLPPETLRKRTINIRVTIDTDPIPRPAEGPGDAADPTSIDQDLGHMVVTASHGVENQGTGGVAFEARAGDVLRFFISSGSNNFEQGVLLEDIRHAGGGEILTNFKYQAVDQTTIVTQSPADVLPARLVQKQFQFYQCVAASHGTGSYDLVFALYDRNEEGQPSLTDHYRWAMQLTAHSNRREP